MKLSMWMIANRLSALDPELHIRDNAPIVLRSARRAYATNCVHVFQVGKDVICNGEGDYIRLKDMSASQAFEIIQCIFDFYDDWNSNVQDAANQMDYQKIIDESWYIFHNPIVLLDANCKVLAISAQYGEDDLDGEWKHLCVFGYSSVNGINYLINDYTEHDMFTPKPQLYKFDGNLLKLNTLSSAIYYENTLCGRINVMEADRSTNSGDVQLLVKLTNMLASSMVRLNTVSDIHASHNLFINLIMKEEVKKEDLDRQMSYYKWKYDDPFTFGIMTSADGTMSQSALLLTRNILVKQLAQHCIFIIDDYIVIIVNQRQVSLKNFNSLLDQLVRENDMLVGYSLPVKGIHAFPMYYRQAIAALEYGKKLKPGEFYYYFYDFALDYIIESGNLEESLYACHPDVLNLWESDRIHDSDKIDTLLTYLNNERSLVNTAQELYVHRNTLIYRIKKIMDMLVYDINDVYTRDYMKLSIRILKLYKQKNGNPFLQPYQKS